MRALIDDSIVPDPWRPQTGDVTEWGLRAMIVCLGMLPAGRMRAEELGT